MSRRLVALVVVGLAAVVLAPAHARESATRIVDRTFVCETGYLGGVYQATIDTYWFAPSPSEPRIPSATVGTSLTTSSLGGVSIGSLAVNPVCKPSRAKVRLTTKGLRGGSFSQFDTSYDCFTSRRVLLRVRGEFAKPTALVLESSYGARQLRAVGPVKRVELALAAFSGRPLAYVSIAGEKKTRLFTSIDCREE